MSGVHVQIDGLVRSHQRGSETIEVLTGVDLDLKPGDQVAIVGPSGSGKSTFLHVLGLLDQPTQGRVRIDGVDVSSLSDRERAEIRGRRVGFVFQAHNLVREHSALGNVMIPVRLAGGRPIVAEARARALLTAVGLASRLDHKPGELSGGEQQRVAVARALVMGPGLVLADEPTGNLDPATAAAVFDILMQLNEQLGSTLVVVTHSMELASRFPRRLRVDRGQLHPL